MTTRALVALTALLLAGEPVSSRLQAQSAKPVLGSFGVDTTQMDRSVKPGDDFFRYVNGTWLATVAIPADKSRYGMFDALRDQAEADVRALVESLSRTPQPAGSVRQKVGDLYASFMDQARVEARGLEPLQADLAAIAAASTKADVLKLMARPDYRGPFGLGISADPADPTRYVVTVSQSGLGMPARDYYLTPGPKFEGYRTAYTTYVTRLLELIGDKTPTESAAAVMTLETKLAVVHWAPERRRNVKDTTNPADRAGLATMIPAVDWPAVLDANGLGAAQRFVVRETSALRDGAALLDTEPVATWRLYLAFHLADTYAAALPQAFDEAHFAYESKALRGIEAPRERWKRGVELLDGLIGEGVGELYVAQHFPPGHKAAMDALVANLRTAMGERLKTLTWMDEATRAQALKKLATFDPRIGYPSTWRDYSAYPVAKDTLFENVRNGELFAWRRRVARLNQPVDRREWRMNAQTVNASYSPLANQITFPAAILQAPFFDPNADPAVNYGAIGAVIGHEIGHGFDDQGREFDETGKVRNWWSEDTNRKFVAATERLAAQYNAYCPVPNLCVNGKLTMGENLGDLGGLEMAYAAYRLSLQGKPAPLIDGFTGDQRFFLAYGQVWRSAMREDALRNLILTNPHAPGDARGNIPVRNVDAWYAAFEVKPGDKGYVPPDQRVHIW